MDDAHTRIYTHLHAHNAASDDEGTMRSAYRACLPPTTPAGDESEARKKKVIARVLVLLAIWQLYVCVCIVPIYMGVYVCA